MKNKAILILALLVSVLFDLTSAEARKFEKFQFVVMGDNRAAQPVVQPETYKRIINEINLLNPDLVVIVGDLIRGYTSDDSLIREEWKEFRRVTGELEMPFYLVVGNHDVWDTLSQKIYLEECGELYYSFNHGGCHFIILDTELIGEMERITGDQLEWLKKDLKRSKNAKHIFVFMHKPIWAFEGEPSGAWSRDVHPLLVKHKVDIVFCGHWHAYQIDYRDGIRYVITGGAGAPIGKYPEAGDFFHYLLCTAEEKNAKIAVIKPGNIFTEEAVKFTDVERHKRIRTQCLSCPYLDLPCPVESKIVLSIDNPFSDSVTGTVKWNIEECKNWKIEPTEEFFSVLPHARSHLNFKVTPPRVEELWYPPPTVQVSYPYVAGKGPILIKRDIRLVPSYECKKMSYPPVINGEVEDWKGVQPISLNRRYQVAARDSIKWTGPEDKSCDIYFSWDNKNLYFLAKVTDDIFCQKGKDKTLSEGDCITLSFDVGDDPRKVGKLDEFITIYFFALTETVPTVYRWYTSSDREICDVEEIELEIQKMKNGEIYEAKIPWAALKADFTPNYETVVGLDIDVTDNDGEKRKGWLQWTPGLMERNDTSYFGKLILR